LTNAGVAFTVSEKPEAGSEGTVRVDEAGRLLVPPELLQELGWFEGRVLELSITPQGELVLRGSSAH